MVLSMCFSLTSCSQDLSENKTSTFSKVKYEMTKQVCNEGRKVVESGKTTCDQRDVEKDVCVSCSSSRLNRLCLLSLSIYHSPFIPVWVSCSL